MYPTNTLEGLCFGITSSDLLVGNRYMGQSGINYIKYSPCPFHEKRQMPGLLARSWHRIFVPLAHPQRMPVVFMLQQDLCAALS